MAQRSRNPENSTDMLSLTVCGINPDRGGQQTIQRTSLTLERESLRYSIEITHMTTPSCKRGYEIFLCPPKDWEFYH